MKLGWHLLEEPVAAPSRSGHVALSSLTSTQISFTDDWALKNMVTSKIIGMRNCMSILLKVPWVVSMVKV